MARTTPHISDGVLTLQEGAGERRVVLESRAWWNWLAAQEQQTFFFENALGRFTARCEYKHGGWYWYAYRKQGGKLHKVYLGKSENLTQARLSAIAGALADSAARQPQETSAPPSESDQIL